MKKGNGIQSVRSRHFAMILYVDLPTLYRLLRIYNNRIVRYAFIVHDKCHYLEDYINDNNELVHSAGEKERVHIHLLLSLYNPTTFSAVRKLFITENDKPMVEVVSDLCSMFRYLIHKDNPEKYQYDINEVESNDLDYYLSLETDGERKDTDQKSLEILDLLQRNVNPFLIAKKYGRDFIIHYRQYKDFVDAIELWEKDNAYRKKLSEDESGNVTEVYDDEQIPFEFD